jgi:two-component system, chemotaxis family, protein-glutamate methylesterase/glutaminase
MSAIRIVSIQNNPEIAGMISRSIRDLHDMEIIGSVTDVEAGRSLCVSNKPDIVLVNDYPAIVEFTSTLLQTLPETGIIIVASGADSTSPKRVVAALAEGAFDFVTGFLNRAAEAGTDGLSNLLVSKIRCCSIQRYSRIVRRESRIDHAERMPSLKASENAFHISLPKNLKAKFDAAVNSIRKTILTKFDVVLIGVSTGGPEALMKLLPAFPDFFPVPIIVVLHMPRDFTAPMAAALDRKTKIRVSEAIDGEEVAAGRAYLARGGFHCTVVRGPTGRIIFQSNDQPPENGCKPAVDALFRSAAPIYCAHAIAVILTGMGTDGTQGCEEIKRHGGTVIAQDEASSVVWGMPGNVVRAGLTSEVLALVKIPDRLCEIVGVKP